MNKDVIITCAVTGDDSKVKNNPYCPVTPEEIADSAIEAAQAGAAIVHIHVRDPETGDFSMKTEHYRSVVKRIRESGVDCLINLTAGMGGYLVVGDNGLEDTPAEGTDFVNQETRLKHVIELCEEGLYRPEICTIDCGTLNFGNGNRTYIATPKYVRKGMEIVRELGVRPELEIFETGNLWYVNQMVQEGMVDDPPFMQLCMGIPWGMPLDIGLLNSLVNMLPDNAVWSSFGIGRMQMPMVAQSVMLGGNVRVGLEDNLYLSRGVYASNAQLVEKARTIVEAMGARIVGPEETRERLNVQKPA